MPDYQKIEVQHLLNFVKNSNCELNRNGTFHKGQDAVVHINNKYDYFRDEIKTTEEFIELSATKSTMSGKHYFVNCDGTVIQTRHWLLSELDEFRTQRK